MAVAATSNAERPVRAIASRRMAQRLQLEFSGEPTKQFQRAFELAYRMQMEATELVDFSTETAETRELYGIDQKETRSFGSKCLMARRLIERGVRFVQVYSDGEWDAHSDVREIIGKCVAEIHSEQVNETRSEMPLSCSSCPSMSIRKLLPRFEHRGGNRV